MGNRWDEFSGAEHQQLAALAYGKLQQGAPSWAIRSKASLLLALVIKRTGPELWEAALPQLLQAAGAEGPAMQEQVGEGGGASGGRGGARVGLSMPQPNRCMLLLPFPLHAGLHGPALRGR